MFNDNTDQPSTPGPDHQSALVGHSIALPENWALWQWTCLRGAGFPAQMVTTLALPGCASVADELIFLKKEADQEHAVALAAMRNDLKYCEDDETKRKLQKALVQLKKYKLTAPLNCPSELPRQKFWKALSSQARLENTFREEFESGMMKVSSRIREIAAHSRFREAVLLQNRAALHTGIDPLLNSGGSPAKIRKKQRLLANYLQRYCTKNDSIGFFGPVGWGRFGPDKQSITAFPGPQLVSKSSVYFEQWCIDALAEVLEKDPLIKEWIPPRCLPSFYLEENKLLLPGGESIELPACESAILKRCTGERTAREIAQEVLSLPGGNFKNMEAVYEVFRKLAKREIISWKIELPWDSSPECRLRDLLQHIGVAEKRQAALGMLDELEYAKKQVGNAIGNAARLDTELEKLESTFSRLTGRNPARNAGKVYGGRTLIYQDCRRDINLQIGMEIVHDLSTPMMLILAGARWFISELASLVRHKIRQVYTEMSRSDPSRPCELIRFWPQIQHIILDHDRALFRSLSEDFYARWQKILSVPRDKREILYKCRDIEKLVQHTFAASHMGWEMGRYSSPDVMIATSSVEAIQKKDYFFVLGELHMGINTLRSDCLLSQHPCPEEMYQAIDYDLPCEQIAPIMPRSWPGATSRTMAVLSPAHKYCVQMTDDSPSMGPRTLPISAFVVHDCPEGLVVQTRDGRLKFDIVEFFGEILSAHTARQGRIMQVEQHLPRVLFDKLVVQREQWSFRAAEMQFALKTDRVDCFLEARRWMREYQLPRFIFAKAHVEVKPFFVDLDSPVYVETLAALVRRVLSSDIPEGIVILTEMLPTMDQLWLSDNTGRRYTSELRAVFIDRS